MFGQGAISMSKNAAPPRHLAYFDLQEALGQPGCPICRLVARDTRRYLQSLLDSVNDVEMRRELRLAGGFCRKHTWQAARLGSHLSVSILWADLVTAFLDTAGHGLTAGRGCMACRKAAQMAEIYCDVLNRHLEQGELQPEYLSSTGLCLPHLQAALTTALPAARQFLANTEKANLTRLHAELAEIIRKHDYRYRDEPWGPEKDAWSRAAAKLAGEQPEGPMPYP